MTEQFTEAQNRQVRQARRQVQAGRMTPGQAREQLKAAGIDMDTAEIVAQAEPAQTATSTIETPKTGTTPTVTRKPRVLAAKQPKAKAEAAPATAAKPAEAKPAQNTRYQGSKAERWDDALLKGGKWGEMAKDLGCTVGALRSHAKYRANTQKRFTLVEDGEDAKLVPVVQ